MTLKSLTTFILLGRVIRDDLHNFFTFLRVRTQCETRAMEWAGLVRRGLTSTPIRYYAILKLVSLSSRAIAPRTLPRKFTEVVLGVEAKYSRYWPPDSPHLHTMDWTTPEWSMHDPAIIRKQERPHNLWLILVIQGRSKLSSADASYQ